MFNAGGTVNYLREKGYEAKHSYRPEKKALNVNYSIHVREELFPSEEYTILNLGNNIEYASSKRKYRIDFRRLFPEYSPKIYIPGQHFCKFPLILRPDHHRQGKHFYIVNSYQDMFQTIEKVKEQHGVVLSHGIEPIPENIEYAVWTGRYFSGEIKSLKLQFKEETYEKTGNIWEDLKPKNHTIGNSIFKWATSIKYKSELRNAARDAMRLSGLHFARVDILWDTKQERALVLEINSRFTIGSDSTRKALCDYIMKYYNDWRKN